MAEKKKLITPIFVARFINLYSPMKNMKESDPRVRYGLTAVFTPAKFSPKDKLRWKAMQEAGAELFQSAFKKSMEKAPSTYKKAFRDGEEKEELGGFGAGTIFLNMTSTLRPQVVDTDGVTVITKEEASVKLYDGVFCRGSGNFFSFDGDGKGIAFGLNNVKKVKDGERMDGRTDASEDFEDLGEEDLSEDDDEDLD